MVMQNRMMQVILRLRLMLVMATTLVCPVSILRKLLVQMLMNKFVRWQRLRLKMENLSENRLRQQNLLSK